MSSSRRNFWSATLVALALSAGFASAAPAFSKPPQDWEQPSVNGARPAADTTSDRALRAHLAAQRALNLQRLIAYRKVGKFPVNTAVAGMLHQFVDPNTGALCAMANLLAQSGHRDWVIEQSRTDNAIALATVSSGRLYDWMLDSGLTQEEINFIQEPGFMVRNPIQLPGPTELRPTIEQENARIDAHLKLVVAQLTANSKRSLDTAVARAKAHLAQLAATVKNVGA